VLDSHDAPSPVRFNDLRVEQIGQRHPTRLGHRAFVLATLALYPMAKMGQYCRPILFEPVGQKQRHAARRQPLNELMHDALGHRQRASADIDDHQ
jgi:hypothetical protein